MYLEGDKWKNWHTRCSDVAIKENKDEEDTKLNTSNAHVANFQNLSIFLPYYVKSRIFIT